MTALPFRDAEQVWALPAPHRPGSSTQYTYVHLKGQCHTIFTTVLYDWNPSGQFHKIFNTACFSAKLKPHSKKTPTLSIKGPDGLT